MYSRYIPPQKEKAVEIPTLRDQEFKSQLHAPSGFSSAQPYARYIPPPKSKAEPAPVQPVKIVFGDDDFVAPIAKPNTSRDDELTGKIEEKKPKKSKPIAVEEPKPVEDAPKKRKKSRTEVAGEDEPKDDVKDTSSKKRRKKEKDQEVASPAKPVPESKPASAPMPVPAPASESASAPQAAEPSGVAADQSPKAKKGKKEKKKKQKGSSLEATAGEDGTDELRKRHRSVFEKVHKSLTANKPVDPTEDGAEAQEAEEEEAAEPEEIHGLEPIPQPEPVIFDESKLTYETLPPWLASPIRVTDETRCPFTDMGISPDSAKVLESKGFKDAFAVQTAVLPLLLPSPDRQGDVVVAAPTGSGKTLAYVLPMVRDISQGLVTKLRGIIVLPTRDLVQQVQVACEASVAAFSIAGGKRVVVGTAMGNKVFKEEQSIIMREEQRYDPAGYKRYLEKQSQLVNLEDSDDEAEFALDLNTARPLPGHVVEHVSKVDILICTPGRLVEHINKTPGFTLDYVRWLVVDEADKLLAQDFQQWLDAVTEKLSVQKPGARDFPGSNKTGPRKVILSATMTRDLSLLNGLKLSRPRLVVLEGAKAGESQTLPGTLKESAIKVRESSHKPLYLLDLLNSELLAPVQKDEEDEAMPDANDSSSSDSDSDSDSSSSSSSEAEQPQKSPTTTTTTTTTKPHKLSSTVLVFTKSNEAALRLSRLLAILSPDLAPLLGTLTSSTKTSKRAATLRAFARGKLRVLVASDLVSRGIDLANLDHVINYDLPISETSYIHRVGRTARAGRAGHAWTLVEHAEARRFWRDFAGEGKGAATTIMRNGKVERVRVGGGDEKSEGGKFGEERVRAYELALEQLKKEAGEGRR
ncbi:P-loop containing nucleoside triphosphate hydrolase protein [Cercophora scortea]|uniref:ATP-dependent RNA helicase n=1 Tax=Cercophora scortea TaxID=314031 RepID=A0AAE0I8P3_9PEZI|nr:P-loop containing nucleoside triphosphate hydrolase protein [Cercophora scortea]